MLIESTRFGQLEIDGERIIRFEDGLLGFAGCKHFALVQTCDDPVFFWLQSLEDPTIAFVVCDPHAFVPDYTVPESSLLALEVCEGAYVSSRQRCKVTLPVDQFVPPTPVDWDPGKPYSGQGGGRDGRKL